MPSYPLIVDDIKTRYGPTSYFTIVIGIAAASSMIKSSA